MTPVSLDELGSVDGTTSPGVASEQVVPRPRDGAEPSPRHGRSSSWAYWQHRYIRITVVADAIVALAAASIGYGLRFGAGPKPWLVGYVLLTVLFPVVWVAALAVLRAYESRFLFVGSDEYRRVLNAGMALTAMIAIVAWAGRIEVARGYVVIVLPVLTIGDLVVRRVLRKRLHRARQRGNGMRRVVVVGYERATANLCRQLQRERYHGMDVVAACLPPHRPSKPRILDVGVDVLGTFDDVAHAVDVSGADAVAVLACPEMDAEVLRRLAWQLEKRGTALLVAPAVMDVAGPRTTIRPVDGLPLLHVEHPELSGGRRLVKSVFDRALAAAALVMLSPLLLAVTVAIRVTSSGQALFRQVRVGRDGSTFSIYKFRTMYVDAEERLAELRSANEHDGVLFKIRNDPRITRLGALLRRYSVDELPQLLNVVLGQMSLVGPRPPLPREVEKYAGDVQRRLVVKPGLTGLWQVSGRSDLSWDESVRLDLRYVENWSLALDLTILWRTLSAVVSSSGAY